MLTVSARAEGSYWFSWSPATGGCGIRILHWPDSASLPLRVASVYLTESPAKMTEANARDHQDLAETLETFGVGIGE